MSADHYYWHRTWFQLKTLHVSPLLALWNISSQDLLTQVASSADEELLKSFHLSLCKVAKVHTYLTDKWLEDRYGEGCADDLKGENN